MLKTMNYLFRFAILFIINFFASQFLYAQTELEPWGNISGIRVDGELMGIQSNLSIVKNNWSEINFTAKERQRPHYERKGDQQIVTTRIDSLFFTETISEAGKGQAHVDIKVQSHADDSLTGIYFTIFLPDSIFENGGVNLNEFKRAGFNETELQKYFETPAKEVQFHSRNRHLIIRFPDPTQLIIKRRQTKYGKGLQVFVPVETGNVKNGQVSVKNFSIEASGIIDKTPVTLHLNTSKTGRPFIGFGGNFRLQNPKTDPEVIDYCLKNLDVRFSRVEMPWGLWQPEINIDPIAEAKSGKLNLHVQKSMEMAQRLYKMGIPVILSAWSPPAWAVVGKPKYGPDSNGVWGNPLDSTKTNVIDKSIADYIVYLKEKYGVEISLFSFNESDLGINIRQTGEEQDKLIKGLGAYFESRGLKTKMLLGDNSDAATYQFINPALNDPATYPYIGAISFHSWRGWDKSTLQKWADAATKIQKPLIVAEGSIDAQAWGYPQIFLEPMYALNEINLYVRLLSICQPEAILQWQLTADYSLLAGGGIFGDTTQLGPTQRFWNLKQLSSTPKDLKAMPISCSSQTVSAAALGDNNKRIYAIHLVNNGATRNVTLTGLPLKVKSLKIFVTDKKESMKEEKKIPVVNGKANFILKETSFTSLFSTP